MKVRQTAVWPIFTQEQVPILKSNFRVILLYSEISYNKNYPIGMHDFVRTYVVE